MLIFVLRDILNIMTDCVFCKIISGDIPAAKIFEDEDSLAFLDINPINIGHTLVVPKKHFDTLYDLPAELIGSLFKNIQMLTVAVKKSVGCEGINIGMNNERAAGQLVPHTHIHIIPRYLNDGFAHWKGKRPYEKGEAEKVAEKIKGTITTR